MKYILSLCLFGLFSPSALSQSNTLLENSTWINAHYNVDPWSWPNYQLSFVVNYCTSTDDTVINSVNYLKLYDCSNGWGNTTYRGALRADSTRWYFVAQDSASEMLLYDFSLMPGDTVGERIFTEHFFSPPNKPYVCQAVDTVLVNGKQRRRLLLGGGNAYWIEGVGCSQGLLWDPEPNISQFALSLECYDKNDSIAHTGITYNNSLSAGNVGCDLSFSVLENKLASPLEIFPNPSAGNFTLRFSNFHEKLQVSVYSLEGRKLFATEADQPELKLELNLPEGTYLLRYEGENTAGAELIEISK